MKSHTVNLLLVSGVCCHHVTTAIRIIFLVCYSCALVLKAKLIGLLTGGGSILSEHQVNKKVCVNVLRAGFVMYVIFKLQIRLFNVERIQSLYKQTKLMIGHQILSEIFEE